MKWYVWLLVFSSLAIGVLIYNERQQNIGRNEAIIECNESEKQILLDIIADLDHQIEVKEAFEQRANMLIQELETEKEALRIQHERDIDIFRATQTNECGDLPHGDAVNGLLSGANFRLN
ncbi:hypothetical protein VCR14J2_390362 [Vibrio coralliirubri]|uniref:hypothetical protein n=1 Tax=Vibrio coralliirubri TaxID=1516159 RepID=UPI00063681C0|nr:hypothetical protein [Vibrio coralliirubri]CDU05737.1 hypothetical protein VCR14J2_390362 [Vibrio coralliirubri]